VYERLDRGLQDLRLRYGGLPSPQDAKQIWTDIWHLDAHHSTALEGNTLVLREVETLLEDGRAVGAKPLAEYLEVKGYADAAQWVYGQALEPDSWNNGEYLSMAEVRHVHYLAMSPVWSVAPHPHAEEAESPGKFRCHNIRPFGGGMVPPIWTLVPPKIDAWVSLVGERAGACVGGTTDRPVPEEIARLHNEFERIHPVIDGNGRTGRLLMNLVLVRIGYPPVVILKRQREAYISAMQRADAGDHGALGELLARAITDSLHRFVLPSIASPVHLVPLAALVSHQLSHAALRQAAQRGRLEATQDQDGVWMSSRRAVDKYLKSRKRPRASKP